MAIYFYNNYFTIRMGYLIFVPTIYYLIQQ
ncbi:hypothetical protein J2783_001052 [Chryseobacterium sediminis]|nr:hypothetical protein [Chryseobacterium sediminis]